MLIILNCFWRVGSFGREGRNVCSPPKWLPSFALCCLFSGGVLQERRVTLVSGQLNVPDNRPSDEAGLYREHVGILVRVCDRDVGQLNVEILVDRVECPVDAEVVLQLHHHVLANQGLKEGIEEHCRRTWN